MLLPHLIVFKYVVLDLMKENDENMKWREVAFRLLNDDMRKYRIAPTRLPEKEENTREEAP